VEVFHITRMQLGAVKKNLTCTNTHTDTVIHFSQCANVT